MEDSRIVGPNGKPIVQQFQVNLHDLEKDVLTAYQDKGVRAAIQLLAVVVRAIGMIAVDARQTLERLNPPPSTPVAPEKGN